MFLPLYFGLLAAQPSVEREKPYRVETVHADNAMSQIGLPLGTEQLSACLPTLK